MLDLIREMFWSPEDHRDAYEWATVLLAHAAVGAVLAAIVSMITRRPALIVSLAYGLLWEGGQLLFAGADPVDCVLDWLAVSIGAWAAIAAWRGDGRRLVVTLATGVAILWTGVRKRK